MQLPELQPAILPQRWRGEAFIAGGYAADQQRASDIDLWVTVPAAQPLSETRQELLRHLEARGFDYEEQHDRDDLGIELDTSYPMFLENCKVAMVTGWAGVEFIRPVHIIVTNGDVDEVLSWFDISTHQIAIVSPFNTPTIVAGNEWTPTDVMPIILKDTPHTRERHRRITARYEGVRRATKLAQSSLPTQQPTRLDMGL